MNTKEEHEANWKLADALRRAEEDGNYEDIIIAESAICDALDLPLDETEQGLTPKAAEAVDAFLAKYADAFRNRQVW
jgi:hypothetical protein